MTERTSLTEMARTRRAFAVEKRSVSRDVTNVESGDDLQSLAPIRRAPLNTAISPFTGLTCRKLHEPPADLRRVFREDDGLNGSAPSPAPLGSGSAAAALIATAEIVAPRPPPMPPRNRDFARALLEQVRQ